MLGGDGDDDDETMSSMSATFFGANIEVRVVLNWIANRWANILCGFIVLEVF